MFKVTTRGMTCGTDCWINDDYFDSYEKVKEFIKNHQSSFAYRNYISYGNVFEKEAPTDGQWRWQHYVSENGANVVGYLVELITPK